jgi:hypothetical protein
MQGTTLVRFFVRPEIKHAPNRATASGRTASAYRPPLPDAKLTRSAS